MVILTNGRTIFSFLYVWHKMLDDEELIRYFTPLISVAILLYAGGMEHINILPCRNLAWVGKLTVMLCLVLFCSVILTRYKPSNLIFSTFSRMLLCSTLNKPNETLVLGRLFVVSGLWAGASMPRIISPQYLNWPAIASAKLDCLSNIAQR
jgi:hypothetical protein